MYEHHELRTSFTQKYYRSGSGPVVRPVICCSSSSSALVGSVSSRPILRLSGDGLCLPLACTAQGIYPLLPQTSEPGFQVVITRVSAATRSANRLRNATLGHLVRMEPRGRLAELFRHEY